MGEFEIAKVDLPSWDWLCLIYLFYLQPRQMIGHILLHTVLRWIGTSSTIEHSCLVILHLKTPFRNENVSAESVGHWQNAWHILQAFWFKIPSNPSFDQMGYHRCIWEFLDSNHIHLCLNNWLGKLNRYKPLQVVDKQQSSRTPRQSSLHDTCIKTVYPQQWS